MTSILAQQINESLRLAFPKKAVGDLRLGLAFSGGADSMALLLGLTQLSRALGQLPWIQAFYVNHHIRGADELASEFSLLLRTTLKLKLPLRIIQGQHVMSPEAGGSLANETEARAYRLHLLETQASALNLDAILTGHHAEDVVEAYFMNAILGRPGFVGIPWWRPPFLRPFLKLSPVQLRQALEKADLGWSEDSSNQDRGILRNWVRHEILPLLESRVPSLKRSILERVEENRLEAEYLQSEIAKNTWTIEAPGIVWLEAKDFFSMPSILRFRSLMQAKDLCRSSLNEDFLVSSVPGLNRLYAARPAREYRWSMKGLSGFLGKTAKDFHLETGGYRFSLKNQRVLVQSRLVLSRKTGYLHVIQDRAVYQLPFAWICGRDAELKNGERSWVPVELPKDKGELIARSLRSRSEGKDLLAVLNSRIPLGNKFEPDIDSMCILERDRRREAVIYASSEKSLSIHILNKPRAQEALELHCWVRGFD